jgi:hypothetical protein
MRAVAILFAALVVVAPLQAQSQGKKQRDRILADEIASYGQASLAEVIETARPHFLKRDLTHIGGEAPWRLLIYIGSQERGDSTVLHTFKASEIKEVRYYKPNEATTRFASENASVILLTLKDGKP